MPTQSDRYSMIGEEGASRGDLLYCTYLSYTTSLHLPLSLQSTFKLISGRHTYLVKEYLAFTCPTPLRLSYRRRDFGGGASLAFGCWFHAGHLPCKCLPLFATYIHVEKVVKIHKRWANSAAWRESATLSMLSLQPLL